MRFGTARLIGYPASYDDVIYRFADYKESMITLLAKVVRVSVETNAIIDAMRALAAKYPYQRAYLPVNRLQHDATLWHW